MKEAPKFVSGTTLIKTYSIQSRYPVHATNYLRSSILYNDKHLPAYVRFFSPKYHLALTFEIIALVFLVFNR